jgi:hypothetical protein
MCPSAFDYGDFEHGESDVKLLLKKLKLSHYTSQRRLRGEDI